MSDPTSKKSGHFYRNKRKEQKDNDETLMKKIPRLEKFYPPSGASTSAATSHVTLSAPDPEEQNQAELVIQEPTQEDIITDHDQPSEIFDSDNVHVPAPELTEYTNTDPGLWKLTPELVDYWCEKGVAGCQNRDSSGEYKASRISDGKEYRSLTNNFFTRKLQNGEEIERDWLIYSPSKGRLYCFQCKLFSSVTTQLSGNGLSDWKHAKVRLSGHENSAEHAQAMAAWLMRVKQKKGGCSGINADMERQLQNERDYWIAVLGRIVEVIKFLAERGLAFFGDNQSLGSPHNGNYLGVLELISKFDPFLAEHLAKHGNKGSGHTSYLSSDICTEFINLMGSQVLKTIAKEVIDAKYFAISVDSTPDISHTDQLTIIVRYVNGEGEPMERFLTFLPNVGHSGAELSEATLSYMAKTGIDIKNCRGQSYDNASSMCGKYEGMQAHIKKENSLVELVPCGAHSLNLVGQRAAESCSVALQFFNMLQEVYVFFSASTARWDVLLQCLDGELVPKRLSDTRWSARYDATRALVKGYEKIYNALEEIHNDENQKAAARCEASGIMRQLESLEMVIMTYFWNDILHRFQPVSKLLQSVDIDLSRAVQLLTSLKDYVTDARHMFCTYEEKAKSVAMNPHYKQEHRRQIRRRKSVNDGDAPEVVLAARDKFRVEVIIPIVDKLQSQIEERLKAYEMLEGRFAFLHRFGELSEEMLQNKAEALVKHYPNDINSDIINEMRHIKFFVKVGDFTNENPLTARSLLKYIISSDTVTVFPNIVIGLRIFLCLFCSNSTGERSFSKMSRIKSNLRSTMLQEKLTALSVMSIEWDILRDINFSSLIAEFANVKARKRVFV